MRWTMTDLSKVERAIGYTFKDKTLLKRALTLASASEENNQLMEFFGDAILEFIVSERIYSDGGTEGLLTERRKALVSDGALTPVSQKLGLDGFLIHGAKKDATNKKAIPSAYEAVTAAIYLDGGMDAAKKFVLSTLDFNKKFKAENFKGALQEELQGAGMPLPEYTGEDLGTPQKHWFRVSVNAFGKTFYGEADSVKGAEQLAAENALKFRKNNK